MTEIEKQDFQSQVSQIVVHRLQEILFFLKKKNYTPLSGDEYEQRNRPQ